MSARKIYLALLEELDRRRRTNELAAYKPYRKLTLIYVSGAGTLPTTANGIWLTFDRAGDKGADGTGVGDFSGPASSVADNIVTFAGTTGKLGKDSGIKASDLIAGPASAIADNIATFNGTSGKLAKDSGIAVSSLAPKASPTFTGVPAAPTAAPGTNTTQLATTGFVKAAIDVVLSGVSASFDTLAELAAAIAGLPFSKSYESPQQTITSGGSLTLAHGLGVKPKNYLAFLQCTTAEGGYSVGDEESVSIGSHEASTNRGLSVVPDATNLVIRFGSQASSAVQITRKDTGGYLNITNASWRFVIRAWA